MTRKQEPPVKRGRGAPSKYHLDIPGQAFKLCLLGATDAELADFFGVAVKTLNEWKKVHPDFRASITRGKLQADAEVAHSLYNRALGYSHAAVKIMQYEGVPVVVDYTEHYPPDTQAASLWLRNRQPAKWRDKQPEDVAMTTEEAALVAQEAIAAAMATTAAPNGSPAAPVPAPLAR